MSNQSAIIRTRLLEVASRTGRATMTFEEALRHHALECLLRRIAETPGSADLLVLRGSLLTRQWLYPVPRPANDLDFAAKGERDDEAIVELVQTACAGSSSFADAARFAPDAISGVPIFGYTNFPGLRVCVPVDICGMHPVLNVDIGYGDPLVPEAEMFSYRAVLPENDCLVPAASRELGFAWKLHEISISGTEWRAKDVLDAYLMAVHTSLDPERLAVALRTAFESRDTPLSLLEPLRSGEFAQVEENRSLWKDELPAYASSIAPYRLEAALAAISGILWTMPDLL